MSKLLIIGLSVFIALLIAINIIVFAANGSDTSTTTNTDTTSQATQPVQQPTTVPTPTPTTAPTQVPTQSPAQTEQAFKDSTTSTTIANLDKDGNSDQGKDVHFTATLASFVKDNSGNTAGANVTDATYSAFIQIGFPGGTDLSQLNKGDTLEVWGTDAGTFSGTNAFGATVQEVGVAAAYMTDQTTSYSTS